MKTLPTIIAIAIATSIASANFIDPEHPTPNDKLEQAALYYGGRMVLNFFDHYFIKHRSIDSDTLDFTLLGLGEKEFADDDRYYELAKVYFRIILQEVSGNMANAKTAEERLQVYAKTKEWLAQVTGRDLSKHDNPAIAVEETRHLSGTDQWVKSYGFFKSKPLIPATPGGNIK